MASNRVQTIGAISIATPVTPNITVPMTITALSALIAVAYVNTLSTFGVSGAGGLWELVVSDVTNKIFIYKNLTPSAGAQNVVIGNTGGGSNTHVTAEIVEVSGLKVGGNHYVSALASQTAAQAWLTAVMSNAAACMGMAVSQQGAGATPLSTVTLPLVLPTGTGLTSGNVSNTNEGDCLVVGYNDYAANANPQGAGTWASNVNNSNYMVGFELAPAAAGVAGKARGLGLGLSLGI